MKVCFEQFLGDNHSWSLVGQNLARALVGLGHEVHLKSTNGWKHFPSDLNPHRRDRLDDKYDMQISYTAMKNFPVYLNPSRSKGNRFGIWNYETNILPRGFAKYYRATDKFLPSSGFSKEIFMENHVPESHMTVVPHGFDVGAFSNEVKFPLKTKKSTKFLANIAQPHLRKNIPGLLRAWGRAFTKNDDVCLVAKVVIKEENAAFDVNFKKLLHEFKLNYPNHAEIEVINQFIPDISSLYFACDVVVTTSFCECWWLPGLEGMAAGKIVIAPNYGGQLEFMNERNSLLVPGKKIMAPQQLQYWTSSPYAAMFEADEEEMARLMKLSHNQRIELTEQFLPEMKKTTSKFTWENAAKQIVGLCQ